MKEFRWNELKSKRLKQVRGVSFEELVQCPVINIVDHSQRDQKLYLFLYHDYVWVAPAIIEEEYVFLKTLFPNRKFTKMYYGGKL